MKIDAQVASICVLARVQVFLIIQQIKVDILRLKDQQKNHQFIIDLAKNAIFKQRQQSKQRMLVADPASEHHIIELKLVVSSPLIIVPSPHGEGQFIIMKLGQMEFSSSIPQGDESDFHAAIFDEYTLHMKQICIFRPKNLEQFAYIFENLDYIHFPEFSDVAKK